MTPRTLGQALWSGGVLLAVLALATAAVVAVAAVLGL